MLEREVEREPASFCRMVLLLAMRLCATCLLSVFSGGLCLPYNILPRIGLPPQSKNKTALAIKASLSGASYLLSALLVFMYVCIWGKDYELQKEV